VKSILAASTREDWEAHGPRIWVRKVGGRKLRIVDLTDDEGRVQIKEQWASSAAGAGLVALRVELSICCGSLLLAKVPAVLVDSGRAFIPWAREEEDGRWWSLAGSMTFAGSSHRGSTWARTPFALTCGGLASS
jgi:hypothetical protein